MAYDEGLAERVREIYSELRVPFNEKKMFGGLAFLLDGRMLCGILGEELMARVGPDEYDDALSRPNVRKMDFTGRPMRGFVMVEPEGIDFDAQLEHWLTKCLEVWRTAANSQKGKKRKS